MAERLAAPLLLQLQELPKRVDRAVKNLRSEAAVHQALRLRERAKHLGRPLAKLQRVREAPLAIAAAWRDGVAVLAPGK